MSDHSKREGTMRNVRKNLLAQQAKLDGLGEHLLAAELNAVIERMNVRLGEPSTREDADRLIRRYFSD